MSYYDYLTMICATAGTFALCFATVIAVYVVYKILKGE